MKYLKGYWAWLKSHPIFLLVSMLLGLVFVLPFIVPFLKKTNLPLVDRIPDVTPTPTSPVQTPKTT